MTSRSEKVRKALVKYPDLAAKDLAKKLKVPVTAVYTERWKASKSVAPKKRGRPSKAWERTRPANIMQKEGQLLAKTLLEDKVEALNAEVANLKHQIVGFRAVISYLEHHVGLETSQ